LASSGRPTATTLCVERGDLHGATGPGDVGVRGNLIGRDGHVVQGGHPIGQRVPQVRVVEVAQGALAFLEAARADGFTFQMRAQYPGEFLGVSGAEDDLKVDSREPSRLHTRYRCRVDAAAPHRRTAATRGH
jgi:hypothetical protein